STEVPLSRIAGLRGARSGSPVLAWIGPEVSGTGVSSVGTSTLPVTDGAGSSSSSRRADSTPAPVPTTSAPPMNAAILVHGLPRDGGAAGAPKSAGAAGSAGGDGVGRGEVWSSSGALASSMRARAEGATAAGGVPARSATVGSAGEGAGGASATTAGDGAAGSAGRRSPRSAAGGVGD